MKKFFPSNLSLLIICIFLLIVTHFNSEAFVSKPIEQIPGVKLPTANPKVTEPPTSVPHVEQKQATPIYKLNFGKPTSLPSPIFVEINNTAPKTEKTANSSTVRILIFILGGAVVVGGLIFFYKSQVKG